MCLGSSQLLLRERDVLGLKREEQFKGWFTRGRKVTRGRMDNHLLTLSSFGSLLLILGLWELHHDLHAIHLISGLGGTSGFVHALVPTHGHNMAQALVWVLDPQALEVLGFRLGRD